MVSLAILIVYTQWRLEISRILLQAYSVSFFIRAIKTANRQRALSLKYGFERKSIWIEKRVQEEFGD
ncbi:hypothetical protein ACZ11_06635 [Lysinibacillus xylanilyticus]|uniref:Uncharacterized protein n=1 Tax=Lysinibacillus xylanilyticus TaxID=582475 RepID=A0A0K9FCL5_9BACI|nr:hypothetical protein ACZ11_06635 [Lysinibacillus xylanilyticus]